MQNRTWAQNDIRLPQQRIKPPIQVFSKMPECQAQGQRSLQWSLLHRIFEFAVGGRLLGFKAVSLIVAIIWHDLISVLSKASIAAWVLGGAPPFAHVPLSRCFSLGGSLPLAVGHLAMASDRGRLEAFQGPRPAATPFIAKAQLKRLSHAQQSFGRQLTKGWQGASTQTYSHHGAPTKQPKKDVSLCPQFQKVARRWFWCWLIWM